MELIVVTLPLEAASAYMNDTIMLFLGSFILAAAIERHCIHRRIALGILTRTGAQARAVWKHGLGFRV